MGANMSTKEKNIILIMSISVTLGGFGLLMFSKSEKGASGRNSDITSSDGREGLVNSIGSSNKKSLIQQVCQGMIVQRTGNNQYLSLETITKILEKSLELIGEEYVEFTINNRKKRRELRKMKASDQYINTIIEYINGIEDILEKNQLEICKYLGITSQQFQDSAIFMMERGYFKQYVMIQASIKQKMKERIVSKKTINKNQLIQVLTYQIQLLTDRPKDMKLMIEKLQHDQEQLQQIPPLLVIMLSDYIFEKYQFEEEDLISFINKKDLINQDDIRQLSETIEHLMYEILGPLQQR